MAPAPPRPSLREVPARTAAGAAAAVRSLYVHVPFCERRCEYCDFAAVGGLAGHLEYVEALRGELRAVLHALPGLELDTVFVGGGTPSLLPAELLAAILDEIRAGARLAPGAEVTVEANPSSTDAARARAWRDAGVTRVSIGIQSLHAATLRFLGRVHDADRAVGAVAEVLGAGIPRVSTDLIHSVPTLDEDAWGETLERVLGLGCGHLSTYELTVEPGTPLHRAVERGMAATVDAEASLRQQRMAVDAAAAAGLAQYEVSNMARAGDECRHNLVYWANGPYLAAGVGAHGHLPVAAAAALGIGAAEVAAAPGAVAVRYRHDRHPAAYVRRAAASPAAPAATVAEAEAIDAAAAEAERVMVGLRRTASGVELHTAGALAEARELAAAGLLRLGGADGRTATVTRRGADVLNAVALRLVTAA